MKSSGQMSRLTYSLIFVLVSSASAGCTAASAQTLTTLTSWTDGEVPWGSLVADANGDLFGTTAGGAGYGTVFEIVKTSSGYASTPTTLVSFDNSNGASPLAGLIADANGNLFGTTSQGGAGFGTVFEIANSGGVYASSPTTLVTFNGSDGAVPEAGLIADANGNLFGTTSQGGAGYGTVFEIANSGGVYASSPTTLASFDFSPHGAVPLAGLIVDANGNLFGTTYLGGAYGKGTVFEIAKTSSGYASTPTTLVSFDFSNGAFPLAGLIVDANGNLFGTTSQGGTTPQGGPGYGTIFEIANSGGVYASTPTTLVTFNGNDGAVPEAGLIADANGNLFGTTNTSNVGGVYGYGTVFEIANSGGVYASSPTTLVIFNGSDGAYPPTGLIADGNGNVFGTTAGDGSDNTGTVFEITGGGFVPPTQLAGTPGSADCGGKITSSLAHTYGGIAHAASALGYASVNALQNAIANFCSK
jgi:hypothetical protein